MSLKTLALSENSTPSKPLDAEIKFKNIHASAFHGEASARDASANGKPQSQGSLLLAKKKRSPYPQGSASQRPSAKTVGNPNMQAVCAGKKSAVVTINSGYEIGVGVLVRPNGYIVTAYHVVKEALVKNPNLRAQVYVKLSNGQRFENVPVLASDAKNDLALIKIPGSSFPQIPVANANAQPGTSVCSIGSPGGKTGVIDTGKVQGILPNGDLRSQLRLDYGNSGGPLVNGQGQLIGINKNIWLNGQGQNTGTSFATPSATVNGFIDRYFRNHPSE